VPRKPGKLRRTCCEASDGKGGRNVRSLRARSDDMTAPEVAKFLGLSEQSIRGVAAGTRGLYRARMKAGSRVFYARLRVEMHQRNMLTKGKCDDCDKMPMDAYFRD